MLNDDILLSYSRGFSYLQPSAIVEELDLPIYCRSITGKMFVWKMICVHGEEPNVGYSSCCGLFILIMTATTASFFVHCQKLNHFSSCTFRFFWTQLLTSEVQPRTRLFIVSLLFCNSCFLFNDFFCGSLSCPTLSFVCISIDACFLVHTKFFCFISASFSVPFFSLTLPKMEKIFRVGSDESELGFDLTHRWTEAWNIRPS